VGVVRTAYQMGSVLSPCFRLYFAVYLLLLVGSSAVGESFFLSLFLVSVV
jgi:hypothetical protein